MKHHLAVIHKAYIRQILSGKKSVECRLGKYFKAPHGAVEQEDLVWLKEPSGPVRGVAQVKSAQTYRNLTPHVLELIREKWGDQIGASRAFWQANAGARVATLIWLGNVCSLEPFTIEKNDRRSWVVLDGPPTPGQETAQ